MLVNRPMATRWTRKREIAVHEAGHAVIAYLLSRPFLYVTTVPTAEMRRRNLDGVVTFAGGWMPPVEMMTGRARQLVEQIVLVLHAGRHTQELWYERIDGGPPFPDFALRKGALQDHQTAVSLVTRMLAGEWVGDYASNKAKEAYTAAHFQAANLVASVEPSLYELVAMGGEDCWRLVDDLTDALVERPRLSWIEVRRVLRRVSRHCNTAVLASYPAFGALLPAMLPVSRHLPLTHRLRERSTPG
jgi:hypothetical protein